MVVSERYACFWSLFNLRFSLYDAQFIMLTLFKFTSFTFTTNLDFSLLFNPHLLWFLYLFSVVLFFPSLPIFLLGVELFFVWPVKGEWCFIQIAIQSRKIGDTRLFSLLLENVKVDLGRKRWGARAIETLVWITAVPTCRHGSHARAARWHPACARCRLVGLDSGVPTQTPGHPYYKRKKSLVWHAWVSADSLMLWKELAWLLRLPTLTPPPAFSFKVGRRLVIFLNPLSCFRI